MAAPAPAVAQCFDTSYGSLDCYDGENACKAEREARIQAMRAINVGKDPGIGACKPRSSWTPYCFELPRVLSCYVDEKSCLTGAKGAGLDLPCVPR